MLRKLKRVVGTGLLIWSGVFVIYGWVVLFKELGQLMVDWENEWKYQRAQKSSR